MVIKEEKMSGLPLAIVWVFFFTFGMSFWFFVIRFIQELFS